jgi:hypothetical protein
MEAVVEVHHNSLPEAPNTTNALIGDVVDRGVVRLEDREALDPNSPKDRTDRSGPQRVQIGLDFGKFRHEET